MKKLLIITSVVVLAGLMLYRYGGLFAGSCDTAGGQRAACLMAEGEIRGNEEKCKKGCPSKDQWTKYCDNKEKLCLEDCALLYFEGKAQGKSDQEINADIAACKNACAEQKAKDLASYKNQKECEDECAVMAEKLLEALKAQYSK